MTNARQRRIGTCRHAMLLAGLVTLAVPALPHAAPAATMLALSEIQRETVPPAEEGTGFPLPDPDAEGGVIKAPLEPLPDAAPQDPATAPEAVPAEEVPDAAAHGPMPEIQYDLSALPEPVRLKREQIVEACLGGDVEALRPLLVAGDNPTQLSLSGIEGDPIDHLREISGDAEGQEILAILLEVFEAGYVHLDAGTDEELYLWPYFFAVPLDSLDARQRVELFTLVTAGDYEDMKQLGAYNFYRAGITPDGQWVMFVAGS